MLLSSLITVTEKFYLYIFIRQEICIESMHVTVNFSWFYVSQFKKKLKELFYVL